MNAYALPAELRLPTPRTIRRRKKPKLARWKLVLMSPLLLFVAAFFLVGPATLVFCIAEPLLLRSATLLPGQVVRLHTSHGSRGGVSNHVDYTFSADGAARSSNQSVESKVFNKLKVGQPVDVRVFYVLGRQVSELDLVWQHYAAERWPVWALSLFWNGFFLLSRRAEARKRQLVRQGTPTLGKITAKRKRSDGKTTSYYIDYTFAPLGAELGAKMRVARRFFDAAETGQTISVLYDPNQPARNLVYEFADYECVPAKFN